MARGFAQWGNDLYTGRKSYDIVGHRNKWFLISGTLVVISVILLIVPGLTPGIDFTGGSEFTVSGVDTSNQQLATDTVQKVVPDDVPQVTAVGGSSLRIQTEQLGADQVESLSNDLARAYGVPDDKVTSSFIGPSWGKDVSTKAITGIIVFLIFVTIVLTIYFRNWRMAVSGLVALFHDLVVTVGIYAAVGWEVTPSTVIGFLTILGYSIYDTVVVFDKVRENTAGTLDQSRFTYDERANLAVNQTLVRSINTSVVALLPVGSILFIGAFVLGAGTLRDISLALFVGLIIGTYSSIFLATPMEVALRDREPAIRAHTKRVHDARVAAAGGAGAEGADAAATVVPRSAGQTRPGSHQGTAAQPKRRKR